MAAPLFGLEDLSAQRGPQLASGYFGSGHAKGTGAVQKINNRSESPLFELTQSDRELCDLGDLGGLIGTGSFGVSMLKARVLCIKLIKFIILLIFVMAQIGSLWKQMRMTE